MEKNRVPLDGTGTQVSYTFNFGWAELFGMTGLPMTQSKPQLMKISNNSRIQVMDNKIHIASVMEIVRQTEYYRKMDKRDRLKQGRE